MESVDYYITKEMNDRLAVLLDGLSRGVASDYPEYCKLVGEIQGVRYALNALVVIRKRLNVDQDLA